MHETRFDTLTRSLTTAGSRRRLVSGLLVGTLGRLLPLGAGPTEAKKKKDCPPCKKKKDGKCKENKPDGTACENGGQCQSGRCVPSQQSPPPPGEPLTCAESCAANCVYCFNRAGNTPLCGDGYRVLCKPCSSDSDCAGTDTPYCTTHLTVRSRDRQQRWEIQANCPPYPVGICTNVIDCNRVN